MIKIADIEVGEFPIILAPMEDVTDPPFRHICKEFGADIMYTEFISSEGLIRDAARSVKKLDFTEFERPIGIQIFGHNIDSKPEPPGTGSKPKIIIYFFETKALAKRFVKIALFRKSSGKDFSYCKSQCACAATGIEHCRDLF